MHLNRRHLLVPALAAAGVLVWWSLKPTQPDLSRARVIGESAPRMPAGGKGTPVAEPSPLPQVHPAPWADILRQADPLLARILAAEHILDLRPADFAQEWPALLTLPNSGLREFMIRQLLRRWGQVDPQAALAAIAPDPFVITLATHEDFILEGWVTQHPQEAWQWGLDSLAGLPLVRAMDPIASGSTARTGGSAQGRMSAMINALIESGQFGQAAALLGTAPDQSLFVGYSSVGPLAEAWSKADQTAALTWMNSLTTSVAKSNALSKETKVLADGDLEAAKALVQSQLNRQDRSAALNGLMNGFAERGDRAGAVRWLQENVGDNVDGAYNSAIEDIFRMTGFASTGLVDLEGERALLAKIMTGPNSMQNIAAMGFVTRLQSQYPTVAIEVILQYNSSKDGALIMVVRDWAKRDPVGALKHVQQLVGVSEATRVKLLAAVHAVGNADSK